jgi:predicted nucleotidyltransferase
VRIFGSVARGEDNGAGDVDLLVDFDPEAKPLDLVELVCDLEDVLGVKVEVGTPALLRTFLRDEVLAFVLALSGLSLCRLGGMVAEGEDSYLSFSTKIAPDKYNQVGLAMYELPNMAFAWILFLLRPRLKAPA